MEIHTVEEDTKIWSGSDLLVSTKLLQPQLRKDSVRRIRLNERLEGGCGKLILIAAPAGFGKTTLVVNWLQERSSRSAWLSLDESDNDLRQFLLCLVTALQSAEPAFGKKILPLLRGPRVPSSQYLLPLLINDLSAIEGEMIVVLDDYHSITEEQIHALLADLLNHVPPNVRVLIITRVDPPLPLARMRVRNELIEIRQNDLEFTEEEAGAFFATTMRTPLQPSWISSLNKRTEGWIAGLQMAAISIRESSNAKQFVEEFAGSNRYVVDYLLEEVLARQPERIQTFLMETSILSQFNASLCEAVTRQPDTHATLEALEHANLFLIPLDRRREWYRYHGLFADLLQYRLRQIHPGRIKELHCRASEWFENQGRIKEAISHAIEIMSPERALQLLERYGFDLVTQSELGVFLKYDHQISDDLKKPYPMLLIAKAWAQVMTHQPGSLPETLSIVEEFVAHPPPDHSPAAVAEVKGHLQAIQAFLLRFTGKLKESRELCMKLLPTLGPGSEMERGLLRFNVARICMKEGKARHAIECFTMCLPDAHRSHNYYIELSALGHLGSQYAIVESLPAAQKRLEDALAYAEQEGLDQYPACGYILYHLGRVLYHRNNLQGAIETLNRAVALGERGNEPDILHNASTVLALSYWAMNDREHALECMKRASLIDTQHAIQIYEASPAHNKAFMDMVLGDDRALTAWIESVRAFDGRDYTTVSEFEATSLMYVFVRQKRFEEILPILKWIRAGAEVLGRPSALFHADVYEALALFGMKQERKAMQAIDRALTYGFQHGWIRLFLSNGAPMQEMLRQYCHNERSRSEARAFAESLLELFSETTARATQKYQGGILDPLSQREEEVLGYLARGFSNQKIADTLFISPNTLKTHIRRLYGKLGVSSRDEALTRAQESGILPKN